MRNDSQMIDICVLTAGRFDLLQQCLSAIEKEMEFTPCNLYIFDNGSPTDELLLFKDLFRQPFITQVKRINRNKGFAIGANSALRMGINSLQLFVSDDVFLQLGCIKSLVQTMQNDPKIGICGLKLLFPKHSTESTRPAGKVQHVGHSVDLHGEIIHPFVGWSPNNPRTCISGERFSVTGAAFMIRHKAFWSVGGFDEIYGLGYYEDVELAIKMKARGWKVWVDTNAIAEHFVGATFAKRNDPVPLQQNKAMFMQRNKQYIKWDDYLYR